MERIQLFPYSILRLEVRAMQWIERLNEALNYVEEHREGEISYEKAARLANCSTHHFQRVFTYIAGVPIGEYIRRRKLTKHLRSGCKSGNKDDDHASPLGALSQSCILCLENHSIGTIQP